MLILYFLIIPIFYLLVKLILYFIVKKYGKFSYDGFSAFGFAYNPEKDIFYSTKNAWQKNFGYTRLYDVFAPFFQMIVDTETIKFNYDNKNWLISFWKGQYGIVTGAEIGLYYTEDKKVNKRTLYMPANENEMLSMHLILYKNGEEISRISSKHWWLAIFKLGMYSKPKDLSMNINITFPNQEMLNAFLKSFQKLGYKQKDFSIIDNTFCFKYGKPRTKKIWTRNWLIDSVRQFINHQNTKLYNTFLGNLIDNNKIDNSKINTNEKFIILNDLLPALVKNKEENRINSQQVMKNIFDKNQNNVTFLVNDIYVGVKNNE